MWLQCVIFASFVFSSFCLDCSKVCNSFQALGLEGGWIPDTAIQASSQLDQHNRPQLARLYNVKHEEDAGGWTARTNDRKQWIQIGFGDPKVITEVLTQGRQDADEWVKRFTVAYSEHGMDYKAYGKGILPKIFDANFDNRMAVMNTFNPPIKAQFIKIYPYEWHNRISMRIDFKGMPGSVRKVEPCHDNSFHIVFVMDGSRQAGRVNFALQKLFVKAAANVFKASGNESLVGLVTYAKKAHVAFRFHPQLSKSNRLLKISRVSFPNEEAEGIDLGLAAAHKLFNLKKPKPEYVKRTVLVIVTGRLTNKKRIKKILTQKHDMEEEGIKVYVAVVGCFVQALKKELGYGNGRIFYLPSFKKLLLHKGDIVHQICQGNDEH